MEYIFEFILELFLEGSIEASQSNKVPKWIRYLLIAVISLIFIVVIGIILFTGILVLNENIIAGIILIIIGLVMLISSIIKFKKIYLTKINNK